MFSFESQYAERLRADITAWTPFICVPTKQLEERRCTFHSYSKSALLHSVNVVRDVGRFLAIFGLRTTVVVSLIRCVYLGRAQVLRPR